MINNDREISSNIYWLTSYVFSGKIVPTNCLWVGNIPIDMKRRDLEQAFSRYGQVKSLDYTNGEPIAIVSYNEIEDAIKARGKMTGVTQFIDGKKVRADSGQSDSSRRGKTNEVFCFIKNSICLFKEICLFVIHILGSTLYGVAWYW